MTKTPAPQKRLNRVLRTLSLIEENAKRATPGPWDTSHGHVVKHEVSGGIRKSYDIACQPWTREMSVYGPHPNSRFGHYADMRHVATCAPDRMLKLCEDVRLLLDGQFDD